MMQMPLNFLKNTTVERLHQLSKVKQHRYAPDTPKSKLQNLSSHGTTWPSKQNCWRQLYILIIQCVAPAATIGGACEPSPGTASKLFNKFPRSILPLTIMCCVHDHRIKSNFSCINSGVDKLQSWPPVRQDTNIYQLLTCTGKSYNAIYQILIKSHQELGARPYYINQWPQELTE